MCGIAGGWTLDHHRSAHDLVWSIVHSQRKRGPDHKAVEEIRSREGVLVFGHNRLSIIDLSEQANQPKWDWTGRVCITFNGEIYNYIELRRELELAGHRFLTSSDTEVILESFKEWGAKCVERFDGMFAFALFDRRDNTLWLFRDRFGVKPLFYFESVDRGFLFASTCRVLASVCGLQPDLPYLCQGSHYLVYENGTERTAYQGIRSLLPGHLLQVTAHSGRISIARERYYDLEARVASLRAELAGAAESGLSERVSSVLRNATTIRLRSDVPVGVSLSGGLDSATVATLSCQAGGDLTGVSFSSPSEPESEGPHVESIARRLGICMIYAWPSQRAMVDAFWNTVDAQEGPFPGMSVVAQNVVFAAARAAGLKVMLGGQGADEAFMGYRKYLIYTLMERPWKWRGLSSALTGCLLASLSEVPAWPEYWANRYRFIGSRPQCLLPAHPISLHVGTRMPVWRRQLQDVCAVSLPTLLRYEDSNSMGNSVESRLPFMDFRLVELGLALPDILKVRFGYGKYVIRRMMREFLPKEVCQTRRKRGFDAFESLWIRGGLGTVIRDALVQLPPSMRSYLNGVDIPEFFSDSRLSRHRAILGEAIALIWLRRRFPEAPLAEYGPVSLTTSEPSACI